MEQNRNFKRCNACAQDILRSICAVHLHSKILLPKTDAKVRRENCKLVLSSGRDCDNHLLTEEHLDGTSLATPKQKGICERCNKEINKISLENSLKPQTHIANFNRSDIQSRRCENFNFELSSSIWDNYVKSKKQKNFQGWVVVLKEAQRSFPSLRELAVSNHIENNTPIQGNTNSIKPYFFCC